MLTFLIRRLLQIIPTLFIISIILFALLALKPGNPIDEMRLGNPGFSQADYDRLVSLYGYDQPWYFRYWKWLGRAIQGDLGPSIKQGVPAVQFVFESRLPNTALLSGLSLFFAFIIAVPLGIYSALRQHSIADYAITIFNFIGVSVPIFWLGIMLIFIFSVYIPQFLPAGGMLTPGIDWPDWGEVAEESSGFAETFSVYLDEAVTFVADRSKRLILPVFALTFLQLAAWTRFMRSSMLEVINMDFIRTARAKGLTQQRVVRRHAVRNAILPIITLVALSVPILFSGAVLTETVFNWPGMGRAILDSIRESDFNVAMASLLFISILILVFNLLADIAYALIDPRIRYD